MLAWLEARTATCEPSSTSKSQLLECLKANEKATIMFSHALTMATTEQKKMVREMRSWSWSDNDLKMCDNEFTAEEFVGVATTLLSQKKATVYKTLRRLCQRGKISIDKSRKPAIYRKNV